MSAETDYQNALAIAYLMAVTGIPPAMALAMYRHYGQVLVINCLSHRREKLINLVSRVYAAIYVDEVMSEVMRRNISSWQNIPWPSFTHLESNTLLRSSPSATAAFAGKQPSWISWPTQGSTHIERN